MRVLLAIADLYFSEPLGAMILSRCCRKQGRQTRLAILQQHDIGKIIDEFQPDVVAHSTMTPDEQLFWGATSGQPSDAFFRKESE